MEATSADSTNQRWEVLKSKQLHLYMHRRVPLAISLWAKSATSVYIEWTLHVLLVVKSRHALKCVGGWTCYNEVEHEFYKGLAYSCILAQGCMSQNQCSRNSMGRVSLSSEISRYPQNGKHLSHPFPLRAETKPLILPLFSSELFAFRAENRNGISFFLQFKMHSKFLSFLSLMV